MHTTFLKCNELFDLRDWAKSDKYTQQIFHWVPELFSHKKVYCLFYLTWPSNELISKIPNGYDIYLIHTGTEYVDWKWISNFCEAFGQSQVVFLSPYSHALYHRDNLKMLEYHVWPLILENYLRDQEPRRIELNNRQYKLSALCNRINEARCYICAHVLQTWQKEDYIVSWRGVLGKDEDLYFLEPCGIERLDQIKKYIATELLTEIIELDSGFSNTPLNNLFCDWVAYNDCVINCTNESVSVSHFWENHSDNIMPGPYLTEKTWKPLISGSALLPVGQFQTYKLLERFGFQFDYPWDKKFDDVPGDFDRFIMIMDCLDFIKTLDLEALNISTQESRAHNQNHILSGDFSRLGKSINDSNINNFLL